MAYEIWVKNNWRQRGKNAEEVSYLLDAAIDKAKELSKKPIGGFYMPQSTQEIFVLDRTGAASKVRGFAVNGKWIYAVDNCKRCANSGIDAKDFTAKCNGCNGASWKHVKPIDIK